MEKKIFISLSTIPPRSKTSLFYDHMTFLHKQTIPFEKIFLCIPKQYKRFYNQYVDQDTIQRLKDFYEERMDIIEMEKDYGPSCKYLGPLLYRYNEIQNNILIIIDDDRFFDIRMNEIYKTSFEKYPKYKIITGDQDFYFQVGRYKQITTDHFLIKESIKKYPAAFMSFALSMDIDFKPLIDYSLKIIDLVPGSFFHDEGILMNYFLAQRIPCLEIEYKFINFVDEEMQDSLVNGRFIDRKKTEILIMETTNAYRLLPQSFYPYHLPIYMRNAFRRS